MKILNYRDKKIYLVTEMTAQERNKYYSPLINNYHSINYFTEQHKIDYEKLKEKRNNTCYWFCKKGAIITFSILDKNVKWEFVPEMKSLF